MDGADHLRLRRLVSRTFTPRHVEALKDRVQLIARQLADDIAVRGRADLVADYANPLPLVVIGDLLGVPDEIRRPFSRWAGAMLDPEYPGQVAEAVEHIHRHLLDLVALRRGTPGDDLLSRLIVARDQGERLTENELVSLGFLLLWTGSENTQHLISSGLLVLLRHPEQLAALRRDTRLLPAAVEEILRFTHPNQLAIRRFPTEDMELGGVMIPAGDTVMLALSSAHRDPACFTDPDRFDIRRQDNAHLALGHGIHYCLGAPLARMEVQVALSTLLERFPHIDLAVSEDRLPWRASFRSHALRQLPITVSTTQG
ncbi:cytochrome P450 family protein [Streptomyces sp. GS7]|uniref:cytochrome P450 family protein n=1 Tax=Streptomyces sp. GS7 TaxID=2692234 RepID=UPI00131777C1|nr:cytochrome P450 [Streptomyces sp. GS7]QHC23187.1 cytochrome P450 [Streptomyces sp. GS7]